MPAVNIYNFPPLLAGIANLALAIFVYAKNPRSDVNRLYALASTSLAIWNAGFFGMYAVPNTREGLWIATEWNVCLHLGLLFLPPLFYHFVLAVTGRRSRALRGMAYVGYAAAFVFLYADARDVFVSELGWVWWNESQQIGGWVPKSGPVSRIFDNFFAIYFLSGVGLLIARYRQATEAVERNRLRYFIAGVVFALVAGVPNFLLVHRVATIYPIGHIAHIIYSFIVAYTIVRYRLMDISVVVRKGFVYSSVTAVIVGCYVVALLLLVPMVGTAFPEPGVPFWVTALVAFGLALAFQPLHQRLQALLDRRLFRKEHEAQHSLRSLSASVTSFLQLDDLLNHTLPQVCRALGVDSSAMYVREGEGDDLTLYSQAGTPVFDTWMRTDDPVVAAVAFLKEPLVRDEVPRMTEALALSHEDQRRLISAGHRLHQLEAQVVVPLMRKGSLGALMLVGEKRTGEIFSPSDVSLLATLANHLSVAMENARLYERLRRAYEELEDTQRQLFQSEKLAAIGELAAGVAHEINNPLGSILLTAQTIRRRLDDDAASGDYVRSIEDNVMRCKEIVRGLLDFARQSTPQMLRTNINEVIGRTLALARPHKSIRLCTIEEELAEDLPAIVADPNQLVQVFLNLLINAGLAMPDGGTIWVRSYRHGDSIRIEIEDTGEGIPPEMMDKIFHPFVTTRPAGESTGLGLSVSYGIVDSHGGRLWAESRVGEGSKFTAELPVAEDLPQAVGTPEDESAGG